MIFADVYKPEVWGGFFTMVGGGAAALTGLIFVALSLGLDDMTKEATHKYRSINTLAGLTTIFVCCGLVLMPDQNHYTVASELLITALVGAVIFLYGFRQAFRFGSKPSKQRLLIGSCLYAAQSAGALLLLSGTASGIYITAVALVLNIAFMISAAWLLVVGLYNKPDNR